MSEQEREIHDYRINLAVCPFCGWRVDASMSLSEAPPKPDDCSICIRCVQISKFDDELKLVIPTWEEAAMYAENMEAIELRMKALMTRFRGPNGERIEGVVLHLPSECGVPEHLDGG